jgi:hypothetical protein
MGWGKFALTPGGPRREAASLEIHCFLWDSYFPCGQCVRRLRWVRVAIGHWTRARVNVPIIDELTTVDSGGFVSMFFIHTLYRDHVIGVLVYGQ